MIRFLSESPVCLEIREEFSQLLYDHYIETRPYDEYVLNIDWDTYKKLYDSGVVEFFTARDEEERIVGYTLYMVHPSLHYKDKIYAVMDLIYIDPEHRGNGLALDLIKYSEEMLLEERDVDLITMSMKTSCPFEKLAEKVGYDKMEYFYTKQLGS